ncbi:MAG TPA: polysaccharide biosynthesis tyrosine autokinase [Egibacteraceae bacterium]|nr:polysaccharide biosynthesis tyrosine autokinase [Egibacteraceae bacterium]
MQGESPGMHLRDYVSVLRRHRLLILFATVLVLGTALLASLLQDPVYEARTRMLLQLSQSPFDPTPSPATGFVATEVQIITSAPVREAVAERIGVAPAVDVMPITGTAVVELRAESTDPARAALIANTYAESYISFRRDQAIESLLAASREIQVRADAIQSEIDDLSARMAALPPCTGTPPSPSCAERDTLQRERDLKLVHVNSFRAKVDQVGVDVALRDGGSQVISPAVASTDPVRPQPMRNGVLALGVGLVFGAGLAFLFDHLDDSIKSKEDFERTARDLDVLGIIPLITGWRKGEAFVVSQAEPSSPAAEAYRTLRTSIQFISVNRTVRTLQITSPAASEGKSTTTANLAVAMARAGRQVIVASCDLRRPRVHEFFGLSNSVGFTSVLLGEVPLSRAVQEVPNEPRLRLLSAGPLPPNPSELLSSPRAAEVLSALRENCDVLLVDCPPVLPVTDATVLASWVDATLLVVTSGSTTRKQLGRTVEMLRQVDAPLVGAVLNGVSTEMAYGYAEYYHRYEPLPANGGGNRNGNGAGTKRRPKTLPKPARSRGRERQ